MANQNQERFKVAYYNAFGEAVFYDLDTNEIIGTYEDLVKQGYI